MNELLEKIKKIIPDIKQEIYDSLDLNSLVCFSTHLLENNNIPLTFENIYVASYLCFPTRFCLIGFKEFPDGARINRSILQCLPKYQNLLMGNAKTGYRLTNLGLSRAREVEGKIKLEYVSKNAKQEDISKRTLDYKKKVEELAERSAFKKFNHNKIEEIGIDEIFEFLEITPYSNKAQIKEKLNYFNTVAEYSKSKKFQEFMKWIRNKEEFKVYLKN